MERRLGHCCLPLKEGTPLRRRSPQMPPNGAKGKRHLPSRDAGQEAATSSRPKLSEDHLVVAESSRKPRPKPRRPALHKIRRSDQTSSVSSYDCWRQGNFRGRASSRPGHPSGENPNEVVFADDISDNDDPNQSGSTAPLDGDGEGGTPGINQNSLDNDAGHFQLNHQWLIMRRGKVWALASIEYYYRNRNTASLFDRQNLLWPP
ncbi:hypothetical protein Cgig2_007172 [Carnegiea gigantea]|uniref:Uncharacterized protein n=1 Tax=Carnegiea gigantea TaxID=171969 RepID=A0A9Q1Q5V4_9CARY|nr:hypothetical protein Cgig2_007172 [Carnegiea gigantea]